MSKNYIQVDLGGKKCGLKFNFGTLEHIERETGEDPLGFTISGSKLISNVAIVIYAGLLSNAECKGVEPDFTKDEVTRWVRQIEDMTIVTDVIEVFQSAYKVKSKASGEEAADTQQGKAALMGGNKGSRVRRA
jgi:hypothetical protein